MMKFILVLTVGVAIGYMVGFRDAQVNNRTIVVRIVERVGGSNRQNFDNDLDRRTEAASAEARRPGR